MVGADNDIDGYVQDGFPRDKRLLRFSSTLCSANHNRQTKLLGKVKKRRLLGESRRIKYRPYEGPEEALASPSTS